MLKPAAPTACINCGVTIGLPQAVSLELVAGADIPVASNVLPMFHPAVISATTSVAVLFVVPPASTWIALFGNDPASKIADNANAATVRTPLKIGLCICTPPLLNYIKIIKL